MSNASQASEIIEILNNTFPFCFLSSKARSELVKDVDKQFFPKNSVIIHEGDLSNKSVYIVKEGVVCTFTSTNASDFIVRVIKKNHYFGERLSLFNIEYPFGFKALKDATCYRITGERFLKLIHDSRAFAESLGNILRDKQGIFSSFERFSLELMRGVATGNISISELLDHYRELQPALHSGAESPDIDFSALTYAVRRLPENVTRIFAYLLTDDLPSEFLKPDQVFDPITSAARRRNIWEMLPGKNMVLLRSGRSDLTDIITCLCLYAVEAYKIRLRFHNPKLILRLDTFVKNMEENDATPDMEKKILLSLPFSEEEVEGLMKVWPDETLKRLYQITRHREMININIRRQVHNYNSRRTELWTEQISRATRKLLDKNPGDLPADVKVHIISSNSHSVTNCLNPYLIENADAIIAWAKKNHHPTCRDTWHNKYNHVYALTDAYIKAHKEIRHKEEYNCGILHLHETASTGIQAQLIDINKLKGHAIDPGITPIPKKSNVLIVNIDYAFGEQAEDILRNLIILFSNNLASINILGKAGSLTGVRGDILLPTAFIEQKSDQFHPVNQVHGLNVTRLKKSLNKIGVHVGPLLTVAGTLLQNKMMLKFYKHIWNCIGLEMEGVYYLRQILEACQIGVISQDVVQRFLYYVSDLPLKKAEHSLSVPLKVSEGLPPLYGITREILSSIFDQES